MAIAEEEPRGFVSKAEYYRALAEIDRLKEELAHQRTQALPEVDMASIVAVKRAVPMQKQCAKLLLLLLRRPEVTHGGLVDGADLVDSRELKVLICLLRRSLRKGGAPAGCIETHWGMGYSLSPQGRQWLLERAPALRSDMVNGQPRRRGQ
jgi:hypothetical protein